MEPEAERYLEERLALSRDLARVTQNPRILRAFLEVPRQEFVPEPGRAHAYEDRPLPLIEDQTISQPSMIAIMLDALDPQPEDKVLEIGAGCGYAAALLGRLAREVHGVEIRPALAEMARATLAALGARNVHVHVGDGSRGLPEQAPFDCILVSAGARHVPPGLVEQLAPGGRIAIPVGGEWGQVLRVGRRHADGSTEVEWERGTPCSFVPLVET
jgi:protein-L-isoaspartate(D-aspartate) O-methyltransferase